MLTADDLYKKVDIKPDGTTPWPDNITKWGDNDPPSTSGVYVISVDKRPSEIELDPLTSETEREKWFDTQEIVYIGRAVNLRKRLHQFRRHKYGASSPHRGGQAILLLKSSKTIRWAAVEDYCLAEDRLIKAFVDHVGRRPFGNRTSSAQKKIQTPN